MNNIIYGDCLDKLTDIPNESIDLIYLDPPFFTERIHTLSNRERTEEFSFNDVWKDNFEYASFLEERIQKMKNTLKETGSIFIHCDKSGEHIIRAVLDKVFGEMNFQSEIIWYYKRWSNSRKGLLPNHQNIYFYSKTKKFKFNLEYTQYSETTNIDQILQKRKRDEHNKSIYDLDENGDFKHNKEKKGVPLGDVWEIPYLNPKAKERVGYPTQKPLLLLERIIKLTTDESDIVLDPFCGSGTTCVAAKLLNRNYIGIDISEDAIKLTQKRLENPIRTESALLKKGRDSYKNANTELLKLLFGTEYHPVQRNKGIDAILVEQYKEAPILIRIQKKDEAIYEVYGFLEKAMKTKKSQKGFLIKTHQNQDSLFIINWEQKNNDKITIIESPSYQITKHLNSQSGSQSTFMYFGKEM